MSSENPSKKELEFFDFVYRRQLIWYKRFTLKEKQPWTMDSILQKYKIINVYRELDKGTVYIINKLKNIENRKIILLNVVFYRFFNRFNLYEKLSLPPLKDFSEKQKEELKKSLIKLKETEPIFNDAYLIAGKNGEEKHISVLDSLSFLWKNIDNMIERIDNCKTQEESFVIIKEIPLVGNFLAYEIWTDLTYFNFFKQNWTDDDFVNIGPGASWGLKIIYGKISKKEDFKKLKHLHEIQKKYLNNKKWIGIHNKNAFSNKPFLSLRNIEHSLCEFRKYNNLSHGKGKRRNFVLKSQ